MSRPRKHHYLPQFYLRKFSASTKMKQIYNICKKKNKIVLANIKDTACIRDFHTYDRDKNSLDYNSVEQYLAKIESTHAETIRNIEKSFQIDDKNKSFIAEYLTLMRFRTPSFANMLRESFRTTIYDSLEIMYHKKELEPIPETVKSKIEELGIKDSLKIQLSNFQILEWMFRQALSKNSALPLENLGYRLWRSTNDFKFITSDNPFSLYKKDFKETEPYGVGLLSKDVEVGFPLSSDLFLQASMDFEDSILDANESTVMELNRRTIVSAEKYIYSSFKNKKLIAQIKKHKMLFAGWKRDSLKYPDGVYYMDRHIPVT